MVQRDREDLVGAAVTRVAMLAVHHVEEIADVVAPEPLIERLAHPFGLGRDTTGEPVVLSLLAKPGREETKGVVPEGIDLYCLAAPRRHHPAIDLGVHPRQLIALGAL